MEKRYQVFISSTFQDLQNARQEVSQALLRADCFPAGMELFPAADEEQFEFIKTIIDQSDYYILISAGRYGSIHPETELSYTEMEYDYAVETGKPIIRLLHKDPFNELKGKFIEQEATATRSLNSFRKKLSNSSLVNYWNDPKELGLLVVSNLMDAIKRRPAVGWVPANRMASSDAELEIFRLKEKLKSASPKSPEESGDLFEYSLPVSITLMAKYDIQKTEDFVFSVLTAIDERIGSGYYDTFSSVQTDISNWSLDWIPFSETDNDLIVKHMFDALVLDKALSVTGNAKLGLTSFGRTVLSKINLARELAPKTPHPSAPSPHP